MFIYILLASLLDKHFFNEHNREAMLVKIGECKLENEKY